MKINCWNETFIIQAENEQDAYYLNRFFRDLENRNVFSGHIELMIGEFDDDGSLDMLNKFFPLQDLDKEFDEGSDYIFVETYFKDHSVKEGQIVGFKFSFMNNWANPHWIKLLKKEIKLSIPPLSQENEETDE